MALNHEESLAMSVLGGPWTSYNCDVVQVEVNAIQSALVGRRQPLGQVDSLEAAGKL